MIRGLWRKIRRYPAKKRILITSLAGAGGILFIGGFVLFLTLRGVPDPTRITERNVAQSTKILDRKGEITLYDVFGEEKRTVIPFEKMPQHAKDAVVAIEDARFYEHGGIDLRGILRAAFVNLTSDSLQGGSTITQQLVVNSLLKRERSLLKKTVRKIREAIIAIIIESRFAKDEILAMYLNQVPFGSNVYGIQAAAESFFGKSAEHLTLAESATLASMLKAPTYYSPFGSHRDELNQRKNLALDRMVEQGYVKKDDADRAKNEELNLKKQKYSILAPHFVMYIREYLAEKYGEAYVEQSGLRVTTTLDWELQQKAEEAVTAGALRNSSLIDARNAALVAMDPKTGEILAMVGSANFFADPSPVNCKPGVTCQLDPQVNVALKKRQPGSAFKPFVYATAFAKGYTPETVLFDIPTEFNTRCNADGTAPAGYSPDDCYMPGNYDETFRGPVSLRNSLAQSLNVTSVKLLYLANVKDSVETANRAGITTIDYDPARYGLALVLGGAEVTLLDMVHGYGVFSREGTQVEKISILKIEDAEGNILEERKIEERTVLDPEVARTVSDILSDNEARQPVFAPRSSLYFPDRQVAAKTGTTQDYRDAWTIGYTPSLVAGVWTGNSNNQPMRQKGSGVLASAPIWRAFMEAALKDAPSESFTKPAPQDIQKPVLRGLWGGQVITIDKISKNLATAETPPEFREDVFIGEPHTILHWVEKDDPRGTVPSEPWRDPQYTNWETAIRRWFQANPMPGVSIPTQFDTIHNEANRPKLFISEPSPGDVVRKGSGLTIKLSFQSVFPVREVEVVVNDMVEKSLFTPHSPIEFNLDTSRFETGELKLKIKVADEVGNRGEAIIPLLLAQ